MKEEKKYIRKLMIERRSKLTSDEVQNKSRRIVERLRGTKQYKNSDIILAYMNTKNEVVTTELIKQAIAEGKTICLPLVFKDKNDMEIYKIESINTDVRIGSYGIYEPIPESTTRISDEKIQLILVPGVGFDVRKNRIGYGGGYYDRFIAKLSLEVLKVALAFDFQVLDEIPSDKLDAKMDIIITEKRILI